MRVVVGLVVLLAVAAGAAAQEAPAGPVTWKADRQEWVRDGSSRLVGDVEIRYQDLVVTAQEVELDQETLRIEARGGVVIDQGPQRLTAASASYDLRERTGVLVDATGDLDPHYHFRAERVEKTGPTTYLLERATFTSCEAEGTPPWRFVVRRAKLEEEGYGRFRGTALEAKGVPVFYLPYLLWPLKQERASGLMVPSFGHNGRRGAYLGTSLFLALDRSYDTTLTLDLFESGEVGFGTEWRWAPEPGAAGRIEAYTIRDDRGDTWQWRVEGRHEQDDIAGFTLLAAVEDLSDVDFFQEFERDFDLTTRRTFESFLYLTRPLGPGSLNLRTERELTYLGTDEIELIQMPEVEYRVRPTRIGRTAAYWSLVGSGSLLDNDRGGELDARYGRFDLFPQLSYSLPGPPWLSVTPTIAGRSTAYTVRQEDGAFVDASLDRSYLEGRVDVVGPSLSRIWDLSFGGVDKVKHLIEPRIQYGYTSEDPDSDLVPQFDEIDRTIPRNRVRASVAQRLYARAADGSGTRELASFEVSQDYSFQEPLTRSFDGTATSPRGPLEMQLRLNPTPRASLDARVGYDTLFDGLRSTSMSAAISDATRRQYANLTWYQSYRPETGERSSSSIRTFVGLGPAGQPIHVDLELNYDLERERFLQQRAVLGYQASCWAVRAEYRDIDLGLRRDRDYRVSIDFTGIGQLLEIKGGLESDG